MFENKSQSAGEQPSRCSCALPSDLKDAPDYRKMYERVSKMASIGVWEYDLLRHELSWSDAVYDLFEVPRGQPITRCAAVRFYSDDSRIEMEALRAQAIETGGSFGIDIKVTTALGTQRWINLTADVEQENGISVRIFGTKQDITERKRAQEQVKHLQSERTHTASRAAMGSIAATLAHELNQPLASIVNYATGTAEYLKSVQIPAPAAIGLREIEVNALRAGEVMRRMRRMIEKGRGNSEPFDLTTVLKDAVIVACPPSAKVSFKLQFAHSGTVAADRVQVMQVAVNIIRNASEAVEGSRDQEISIETHEDGDFIIVTIADTGPGLPADLNLFEPVDSAKAGGMGIGLSICRTIVEGNGGKIWASSEASGAQFCFKLPKLDSSPD
ncbi:PAS domain-containing sensor histidine kinase [Erythrobacter sp.]|uniref:sensor histidine kinase n=1 Tax=Erythrobacter sp. TaxID=1042 RepID=UPI0025ED6EF5|nr:PAS domain-containing sensor histidine kinase [Erythrobacter sp.]